MKQKLCTKCGETKPATLEYFYHNKRLKSGLSSWCKICGIKTATKYFKTEKGREVQRKAGKKSRQTEKYKLYEHKRGLRRNYNVALEQYDEIFEKQDGVCAICGGINKNGHRLYVDHNHKTGKVRKLLCCLCNNLIGNAKEDIIILRSAINYLKEN